MKTFLILTDQMMIYIDAGHWTLFQFQQRVDVPHQLQRVSTCNHHWYLPRVAFPFIMGTLDWQIKDPVNWGSFPDMSFLQTIYLSQIEIYSVVDFGIWFKFEYLHCLNAYRAMFKAALYIRGQSKFFRNSAGWWLSSLLSSNLGGMFRYIYIYIYIYIYQNDVCLGFSISTFVGYLMPNQFLYKLTVPFSNNSVLHKYTV